jgi:hypothetical protein
LTLPPEQLMPLSPLPLRHALACLAACTACDLAHAAEWSAQPSCWWYLDYDSNRRLAPEGEIPDAMGSMTLDLLLRRLTQTDELTIHPQFDLQRFTKDSALNSDNGSLQLAASHHAELWSVATKAGYSRDSTLITELASTGIIDANTHQDSLSADLSATRKLSAGQHLDADVGYSDVSYPDGLQAGLVGYHFSNGSLTYGYAYSQRTSLSLIATGSEVRSQTAVNSQDEGLSLQWMHSFTSLLTMSASIGASRSRVAGASGSGSLWNFTLVHEGERNRWSFAVNHDVEPNGRGLLIDHEEVDLALRRAVAPHLYATLKATGIRNNDLITGLSVDERRYFAGDAGLEWQAAPQWVLDVTAGYSQSTEPVPYQLAHGWRGALTLRWTPRPWSVSR